MEKQKVFELIGEIMVWLFSGMGMAVLCFYTIEKFITYILKQFGYWKILIEYAIDYKKWKKWKKENNQKKILLDNYHDTKKLWPLQPVDNKYKEMVIDSMVEAYNQDLEDVKNDITEIDFETIEKLKIK